MSDNKENKDKDKDKDNKNKITAKISKNIGIFKQFIIEKVNDESKHEESKEFQEVLKQFQTTREELAALAARAESWLNTMNQMHDELGFFGSALATIGSHRKSDPKTAGVVQAFVPCNSLLQGQQKRFNEVLHDTMVKPLKDLMENQVKQTVGLIKKLEVDRLDYEARKAKYAKFQSRGDEDPEKQHVKMRHDDAKKEYEATKEKIAKNLQVIEAKKNILLQQNLSDLVKAYYLYFSRSADAINSKVRDVIDINAPLSTEKKHRRTKSELARTASPGRTLSPTPQRRPSSRSSMIVTPVSHSGQARRSLASGTPMQQERPSAWPAAAAAAGASVSSMASVSSGASVSSSGASVSSGGYEAPSLIVDPKILQSSSSSPTPTSSISLTLPSEVGEREKRLEESRPELVSSDFATVEDDASKKESEQSDNDE